MLKLDLLHIVVVVISRLIFLLHTPFSEGIEAVADPCASRIYAVKLLYSCLQRFSAAEVEVRIDLSIARNDLKFYALMLTQSGLRTGVIRELIPGLRSCPVITATYVGKSTRIYPRPEKLSKSHFIFSSPTLHLGFNRNPKSEFIVFLCPRQRAQIR